MKTVSEILMEKRMELGYTQREVGSALEVSPMAIHYSESLERPQVSENLLDRLCVFYGLDGKALQVQHKKEHTEMLIQRKKDRKAKKAANA